MTAPTLPTPGDTSQANTWGTMLIDWLNTYGNETVFNVLAYGATGGGVTPDSATIQAAIDDAATAHGIVYLPPGTYLLDAPLTLIDYANIIGVPNRTILKARDINESIFDFSAISANVTYLRLKGLVFQATTTGSYGIYSPSDTYYLAQMRIEDCRFDASLQCGVKGLFGDVQFVKCLFGFEGTPGAVCQAIYAEGKNTKYSFNVRFNSCYFNGQVGCDGAVQLRTGHATLFDDCVFEAMSTRAIYAEGMTDIILINCNFENIDPVSGNEVIFELRKDWEGLNSPTYLEMIGGRIGQTVGMTTALAYLESTCHASFRSCKITATDNYFTMITGPAYDYGLTVEQCYAGVLSGIGAGYIRGGYFSGGIGIANQTTGGGFIDLYEDADYGTNKITYMPNGAIGANRTIDPIVTGFLTTVCKTIDVNDDASTDDYQFDDDVANTTEQPITLTNILPAYAELVSWQIRCFETVTGSTAMQIDFGTSSGGAELGTGSPDTANDIICTAAGAAPALAATNAARSLYVSGTPGANWNTLDAGRWAIMITYVSYNDVYTQKNP